MTNSIVKGGRELRLGYTTGSCATAAATAATTMLLSQTPLEQLLITLPRGEQVTFALEKVSIAPDKAMCAVVKDAGDDPDVTDGITIVATCEFIEEGLVIEGGEGIGVVTMDGLPLAKGQAAINPVPRQMITSNVQAVCQHYAYTGGLLITLAAPGGDTIALRTFNPRLGIMGGISILGTTGIVEPMSEKAMVDTVKLLLNKQKLIDPATVVITPGNYGRSFVTEKLGVDSGRVVAYSNFLGECLDYIVYKNFQHILLVGHFGKLVKVAGGIMHTHSSVADCRMEILTAHAACAGGDSSLAQKLMECPTTDAAVALLEQHNLGRAVYDSLLEKMLFHLEERIARTAHKKPPCNKSSSKDKSSSQGKSQDGGTSQGNDGQQITDNRRMAEGGDKTQGLQQAKDRPQYMDTQQTDIPPMPASPEDEYHQKNMSKPNIELVVFSGETILLQSRGAEALIRHCRKENA